MVQVVEDREFAERCTGTGLFAVEPSTRDRSRDNAWIDDSFEDGGSAGPFGEKQLMARLGLLGGIAFLSAAFAIPAALTGSQAALPLTAFAALCAIVFMECCCNGR